LQVDHFIVKNQCMIKTGQPIEIELTDGTIKSGAFFQRWQKKNSTPQLVITEKIGKDREKLHYINENEINDIRVLGPYGKPQLYRIK